MALLGIFIVLVGLVFVMFPMISFIGMGFIGLVDAWQDHPRVNHEHGQQSQA